MEGRDRKENGGVEAKFFYNFGSVRQEGAHYRYLLKIMNGLFTADSKYTNNIFPLDLVAIPVDLASVPWFHESCCRHPTSVPQN